MRRAVPLTVLAALLAGAAWWAMRRDGAAPTQGGAADTREGDRVPAAELRGAPSDPGAPAPKAAAGTVAGESARRILVRGTLAGLGASDGERAVVFAYSLPGTGSGPSRPARHDGTFELDVSALALAPHHLVVTVDHPDFLWASAAVEEASETTEADGTWIGSIVVPLVRAGALTVRVVDDRGEPARDATVGAFVVSDGVPGEWICDKKVTDAAGAAGLRVPAEGEVLVLARAAGFAPTARRVPVATPDPVVLALPRGVAIEGRVTEQGRPVAGGSLLVSRLGEGHPLRLGPTEEETNSWEGDRAFAGEVHAVTDDDGRYRAGGLGEGGHRVLLQRLPGDREPIGYERTESAPARDVDFDVATAHVEVRVTSEGRPLEEATLWFFAGRSVLARTTDADGRAHADLAAGGMYRVQVDASGHRQRFLELRAPLAGGRDVQDVAMERIALGRVAVSVRTPDGRTLRRAGLAFFRDAVGADETSGVRFPDLAADDRFHVDDVEVGSYRLVVRPGRHWNPDWSWDDPGTWLDEEVRVEVPVEGEAEVKVVARQGGRLRIDVRDARGAGLGARCVLRDAAGNDLDVDLATRLPNGSTSFGGGWFVAGGTCEVDHALRPGRYRLEVEADRYAPRAVDVDVVAGETRTASVTLEALR